MRNNTNPKRRISTRPFAVSILLALAAILALSSAAPAQTTVDYDTDDDGYIDVSTHAQLNAIRWDLDANGDPASANATDYGTAFPNRVTTSSGRMGCPSGTCTGYELTANIDLDTDGDGNIGTDTGDAYYNSGEGWMPIGSDTSAAARYSGDFKGNGFTIDNLFISRSTVNYQGLFGGLHTTASVETLGITNANVTGQQHVGILTAANYGEIVACYTTGSVTAANNNAGGLVGWTNSSIHSSYSTASASAPSNVGGLLGIKAATGSVTNSYSTGAVTRSSGTATTIGGLVGAATSGTGTVTASYYDSTTSGCVSGSTTGCTGSAAGTAQTTSNLQSPTDYTGIYAAWNVNLDGVAGRDAPWDFGTSSQYPTLVYHLINDWDNNDNGLIDIYNLAQLHAIREDLNGNGDSTNSAYLEAFPRRDSSASGRMGCPSGACTGYELMADLDFDTNGNGIVGTGDTADTYYNGGAGWEAIGHARDVTVHATRYQATFKGNGHTISNLFINRPSASNRDIALFGAIHTNARIESLGVINANVSGGRDVGILVGKSYGEIVACYTTGAVSSSGDRAGGLAGNGRGSSASIHSSYSTASVTASSIAGGLVAYFSSGSVTNSYSTGRVTASSNAGGLVGSRASGDEGTITASYWNTQTSGQSTSAGTGAVGKTTAELQSPTGYNGIYADWNANIDGQSGADDPWAFGTSSEYPALKYDGHNPFDQGHGDYDKDDDGYIEVNSLAQLDAVRHDLDGDGDPVATAATAYGAAFAGRDTRAATRMGCPSGTCTGYELTANLDFDTNGNGIVGTDTGDAYYNSGNGWDPIGRDSSTTARYSGDFKGNGYTINNLFISRTGTNGNDVGLFGSTHATSRIETLGVTNAAVAGNRWVGILVGSLYGNVVACYTTGAVTSTSSSGNNYGGLVGAMWRHAGLAQSTVSSSYSTASVTGPGTIGGLVGGLSNGAITHSYSTGRVSGAATTLGGLIGGTSATPANYTVTASYWDSQTSGLATSAGGSGAVAKTTFQLQVPDRYSGIYSAWNANLDGVAGGDNPWYFGSRIEYPTLIYDTIVDYDVDDDRLIEVENLAQLNVVRYDLYGSGSPASGGNTTAYNAAFPRRVSAATGRMGCPATCQGYELTANLDFDENGDGAIDGTNDPTYWASGAGWDPIGDNSAATARYRAAFKGNGYTINNLFIMRTGATGDDKGLFGGTHTTSRIESLGVTNANVTGRNYVGILVGSSTGAVVASYTTGAVSGRQWVGGLVGWMDRTGGDGASVDTSYSTASVSGTHGSVGGLVGYVGAQGDSVQRSYSTGRVTGTNTATGGLIGYIDSGGSVTTSYWDTVSSGRAPRTTAADIGPSVGTNLDLQGVGKTPRELQTVTGYTGIYADWNANLDGEAGADDPWHFGNGMQYPMLKYKGMNLDPQGNQAMGIADNWNAPVAGERLGVCLTPEVFPRRGIVSGQTYHEAWVWEWSANGGTGWTVISGAGDGDSPPTYEYSPTATDVGRYIRAKVKLTDGSFAITRPLGGPVVAATDAAITASGATAGAAIPFINGHAAPQVGRQVVASDVLLPGDRDVRSGWQRCPNNTAPHSDCVSIPLRWQVSYTPVAADVGNYLRYYVYYQAGDGTWTRRVTDFTTGVVAAQ